MPEGDSVYQLARRLEPLTGRTVTGWDARTPALATTDATGAVVRRVWPWGKHLFWELATPEGSDILHTHLKMEGHWRIHPAGTRWSEPAHTARIVVRVSGATDGAPEVELVGHSLGLVELWPAAQYPARTAHLGPDPLGPDWDSPGRWPRPGRDEAVARLAALRATTIGEALLDQRVLAGLGTIYRAETCFLSGIHPASDVGRLDPEQVVDLAARLLQFNHDRPVRVFTGNERRGANTWVHGRTHRPCHRCGAAIRQAELGGAHSVADPKVDQQRAIWWCPNCQPLLREPGTAN
ncbi:Fpg/Nei family DNA glycosylase [Tessaracoccus rhinocerotis]|uniref:DNA-(apurinic or apyrimidinic site) lyase n=1 Tax=Tessaracoccus rhinocerotis TaxID=1689449 RepID=A0A553K4Q8_9ACTN|nr:DNA-formamidopyrimidine glycosylase family protein [Tessaracoccus rhinocerotis]TRY19693.1 Fpg/Nei family DNA glycosylase [Tessaracoccus rhinocerotis]